MYRDCALDKLRDFLAGKGLQAMIVPSADPHFGEYTQPHYRVREWLSGFTGSAGTLVVTEKSAALWTDSRYFIQAESQLQGARIRLMKQGMPQTPSIEQWIKGEYPDGANVALDGRLFSLSQYRKMEKELAPLCRCVPVEDPFDAIWSERPAVEFKTIKALSRKSCGERTSEKFKRFKQTAAVAEDERFVYYLSACDDIAWLCNIRGADIEYNPLPQSYMLITNSAMHLFASLENMDEELQQALSAEGVELHSYSSFESVLASLSADMKRFYCSDAISVTHYRIFSAEGAEQVEDCMPGGIVANLKAVKNNWEIEGFRKAFLYDGAAWCKVLFKIDKALSEGVLLTESMVKSFFTGIRSENEFYAGESFEPIVAFGKNAALPHYSVSQQSDSIISGNGFLLMDTGAHYSFGGTTDTTRTIPVGVPDERQKKFYTLVLKGMIDLSMAHFPEGTRGSSLDILARGPLYNEGAMYYHGTGHGIGHYLCVHEGPQSIRREENPVVLKAGMVLSNEPAIYFEGEYGIRTENVVAVRETEATRFGSFYSFETFTLVPISLSAVDKSLLTDAEIAWLNDFHMAVFKKISPLLDAEEKEWLERATALL